MLIECVPNVSDGRNPELIASLAEGIRRTQGVRLLNHSSDTSHNRSVFTLVGGRDALEAAILGLVAGAAAGIDLRVQRGEHPRIGAVDVVPFVPLEGAAMADCVALARRVGAAMARRFSIPVYLYEHASDTPRRRQLEDIRRGGFEGLAAKMADPAWHPDFGPATPHPSAGATAVGARGILIAYNVNLATDRLEVAREIAAVIRASSGGYPCVKAMGVALADRGIVQVSMNLTNYEVTSMPQVFDAITREAERRGVHVLGSEVVGLVPAAALAGATQSHLKLDGLKPDQILEEALKTAP